MPRWRCTVCGEPEEPPPDVTAVDGQLFIADCAGCQAERLFRHE